MLLQLLILICLVLLYIYFVFIKKCKKTVRFDDNPKIYYI